MYKDGAKGIPSLVRCSFVGQKEAAVNLCRGCENLSSSHFYQGKEDIPLLTNCVHPTEQLLDTNRKGSLDFEEFSDGLHKVPGSPSHVAATRVCCHPDTSAMDAQVA